MVVSGCEEEDGPLLLESTSNSIPDINSDQDLLVPKDRNIPIPMIREVYKKEIIQEPVVIKSKKLAPVSENNDLHAVK
jgi:hypothetical protein